MQSSENEVIKLNSIINTESARGAVEKWLVELEQLMKKSIHRVRWNQSYNLIVEKIVKNCNIFLWLIFLGN